MLHYPKMPGSRNAPGGTCWAFEKYDGTNLHFEWDRDFGWHSFGARRDEFNLTDAGVQQFEDAHPNLTGAAALFHSTLADGLEQVFLKEAWYTGYQNVKVFAEYLGPNSFAGLHKDDDPKDLVLFDVQADGYGMIGPKRFVADFGHLPSARVVYKGKLTGQFSEDVRRGKYNVREGVVCKGGAGGADVWMVKIKTYAYMERLKEAFAQNWENFWE